jgi:anhydro-N-acetylmuramic acid kinase
VVVHLVAHRGPEDAVLGLLCEQEVEALLRHPYFRREPPKSTGRETFGDAFLAAAKPLARLSGPDRLATLTRFVARGIHDACARFVFPRAPVAELLISGGGARNPVLRRHLQSLFSPIPVRPTDERGVPGDAREAMAFALLGWATLHGVPANVPIATGARREVVLGAIVPGPRRKR